MKHSIEDIFAKAKQVMQDLNGKYYSEKSVQTPVFQEIDDTISEENNGHSRSVWTVAIRSIYNNLDFLIISDETCEPINYQDFNTTIMAIYKDKNGKYYRLDLE